MENNKNHILVVDDDDRIRNLLKDFLSDADLTEEQFYEICDRFTDRKLFKVNSENELIKDEFHNIEKINYDNVV